jgi:hypothetical protein
MEGIADTHRVHHRTAERHSLASARPVGSKPARYPQPSPTTLAEHPPARPPPRTPTSGLPEYYSHPGRNFTILADGHRAVRHRDKKGILAHHVCRNRDNRPVLHDMGFDRHTYPTWQPQARAELPRAVTSRRQAGTRKIV